MIKLSQIIRALNENLKSEFPKIEIDTKDLSEEFKRPSFRIDLENVKTENYNNSYKKREITIRIYYFTSKEKATRLEKIDIIDKLEFLLRPYLIVEDKFVLPINELDFEEVEDGVIITSFILSTYEEIEDNSTEPPMEELDINYKK